VKHSNAVISMLEVLCVNHESSLEAVVCEPHRLEILTEELNQQLQCGYELQQTLDAVMVAHGTGHLRGS